MGRLKGERPVHKAMLYLWKDQFDALAKIYRQEGTPVTMLVRQAVDDFLKARRGKK